MIEMIRQELKEEGFSVSISKPCQWFGIPRRTVYYKPVKAAPKINPRFAEPIKAMIEELPSFGYRTVPYLLGLNKNIVQRIFQLKGCRSRNEPLALGLASRPCPGWRQLLTSVGLPICAASGPVVMDGQRWRW
jgi:putative transposase